MARDRKIHETDHVDPETGETGYGMPRNWDAEEREAGQELPAYMGNRKAARDRPIHTEVHVGSREEAKRLDASLSRACADTLIAKKHNKWTVFANYSPENAVDVARELADFL